MIYRFVSMLLIIVLSGCATAGDVSRPAETGAETGADNLLPVDDNVSIGTLDNGLRYYIRQNQKPEKRMELRLVVNTGSILEKDDQRGLAHFLEHMAFNGTEHFEKQELVDYLESIGMRFGPDLNAYTSFDETVYMLQVPTDSLEIMEKAFLILEDWAHNMSLDPEEIDKERGVIVEEWRLHRGADARMQDKQLPVLFSGSRYAERLPIGLMDVVENFEYDTLRDFYRSWYRPDLMAVIAVGDFDPELIEEHIKRHFSNLRNPGEEPERKLYPVPDHEQTLFAIATDPEHTGNSATIFFKHEPKRETTLNDYRRSIIERMYHSMLNQRLDELTRTAEPPFLYGVSNSTRFVRSLDVYYLSTGVEENGIEKGLNTLLTEAARARRYGFTQTELDRVKKDMLRGMEQAYRERDKTQSASFAGEYTRNFLSDEPIPGIESEYEYYKMFVPGVTLNDLNGLAERWITDDNRVIFVNAPEKDGVEVPSEQDIMAIIDQVERKDIEPYTEDVSDEPLVQQAPEPSPVVSEKYYHELDVTEWLLGNGIRVVLKPTDFKNDQVLFSSFSPGGTSLVATEDIVPAETATMIVEESGLGQFTAVDLEKKLAGTVVSVSPYIGEFREGISGGASPQDMETMFQLIYLTCTEPRRDEEAYRSVVNRVRAIIENRSLSPESAFSDTILVTMANYHPREVPWSVERLEQMDLDTSYRIYRDRFSDAGDFTFIFVGNFTVDGIKPLVETWLGGLPSKGRKESWRDTGIDPPEGIVEKRVYRGIEPKSQSALIFTGPFQWSRENRYILDSMASALRIKFREVLREDMGGTYGVGVSASMTNIPEEEYRISISFGSDPGRAEDLNHVVFAQLDSIKTIGLDGDYLKKVKEMQVRSREVNLKENSFWLSILNSYYYNNEDPQLILDYDTLVNNLTMTDVQQAARRSFHDESYARFVLYPAEMKQ